MQVVLGADHNGFNLKNKIKEWLDDSDLTAFDGTKINVLDAGADTLDPADDFVDFVKNAVEIADASNRENPPEASPAMLILICGSGGGVCIAVNRFDDYRGVIVNSEEGARLARTDNNANALCLSALQLENDFDLCQNIITRWLTTPFEKQERFVRRIEKLDKIKEG